MRYLLAIGAAAISLGTATTDALAAGGAAGGPADAHLVPMDELSVPVVDGGRTDGTLRVKLVLEMAGDGDDAGAMPPLRAAALGTTIEFARLYVSPMTPVNASRLAHDLTGALHREDERVTRVLVVEIAAARA